MSSFEFAFSLFGLLLGLSVAELMAGFARVLRARRSVRLGWLTPLLGLLLLVDLVTFWSNAWTVRERIPPSFEGLLFGTVIAAAYYLSASLVFPETPAQQDLDEHAMRHKGQVMAGVVTANLLATIAISAMLGQWFPNWLSVVVPLVYTGLAVALALSQRKALCVALLCVILSLYALFRLL